MISTSAWLSPKGFKKKTARQLQVFENPIKVKESKQRSRKRVPMQRITVVVQERCGKGKAALSYSASSCHPNSVSYHRELLNLPLSLMTKVNIGLETQWNAFSWPHVPHFVLCSQNYTFHMLLSSFLLFVDTCPASQRAESPGRAVALNRSGQMGRRTRALWQHAPTLSEEFGVPQTQNMSFFGFSGRSLQT